MKPKRQQFDSRLNCGERGYDNQWHKVRMLKAKSSPLCELCEQQDIDTPVDVVHHIKSIEEAPELRLVMSNLMSLCRDCHEAIHGRKILIGCGVDGLPLNPTHGWRK
jgi:5-methylcytosine-specific restriction enzyme A